MKKQEESGYPIYTINEILNKFKIDRRKNWYVFGGTVVRSCTETAPCPECGTSGCPECGYQGKRRFSWPQPFIDPNTGNPLLVDGKNFTKI